MITLIRNIDLGGKKTELKEAICIIKSSDGQAITVSEKEARDICVELEKTFFDAPSYDDLEDKANELEYKVDELRDRLYCYENREW